MGETLKKGSVQVKLPIIIFISNVISKSNVFILLYGEYASETGLGQAELRQKVFTNQIKQIVRQINHVLLYMIICYIVQVRLVDFYILDSERSE